MRRQKASDFDQELLDLYDSYAHGLIERREFLNKAAKFAVGGVTAAALLETLSPNYALAKQVLVPDASARVGVAIHGASAIGDAKLAFEHLADVAQRHLGRGLESYGLLVDDLHVYRAIVSRRPIGIEHPQSRAARALRDVAQMILEDARTPALV